MRRHMRALSVFLLLLSAASAQERAGEEAHPFSVTLYDLRRAQYVCTILTEDGHLRREVTSISSATGQVGRPDIFEGAASDNDIQRVRSLVTDPAFQNATQSNPKGMALAPPPGRIFVAEPVLSGKKQTVVFVDATGQVPPPGYILGLLSFAQDVRDRKLPRLKGAKPLCRKLSQH